MAFLERKHSWECELLEDTFIHTVLIEQEGKSLKYLGHLSLSLGLRRQNSRASPTLPPTPGLWNVQIVIGLCLGTGAAP